jgi:L-ascorbate metabolism protein UlaG (beta-lactamase superfamily)
MIQPFKTGKALADEIRATTLDGPGVAVWWLGQSGYVFKSRETTLVVDPYLSEHLTAKYADTEKPHIRMTACPVRGSELTGIGLVISSHKHSDHMDPGTIPDLLEANPGTPYLFPRAHRDHVLSWGVPEDRLLLADVDRPVKRSGVTVVPKPAAHAHLDRMDGIGYPHMGFRIAMGGLQIYHSGDTVPFKGLVQNVTGADLAFFPINGRDARRVALGTPGNTSIDEALSIAVLAGVDTLVPHHYDLFSFNTADINQFKERARIAYPDQKIRVLECGRMALFGGES